MNAAVAVVLIFQGEQTLMTRRWYCLVRWCRCQAVQWYEYSTLISIYHPIYQPVLYCLYIYHYILLVLVILYHQDGWPQPSQPGMAGPPTLLTVHYSPCNFSSSLNAHEKAIENYTICNSKNTNEKTLKSHAQIFQP